MVVCTFCPLIIPLLALSSITGIHPVRGPVSGRVETVVARSVGSTGSRPHYANLFRIRWNAASIRGTAASSGVMRLPPLVGADRWLVGTSVQSRNRECYYRQRNELEAAD